MANKCCKFVVSLILVLLIQRLRYDFLENIAVARKRRKLSQSELAKQVGRIVVTIGRYERNEIKQSIDIATKMVDIQKSPEDKKCCNDFN